MQPEFSRQLPPPVRALLAKIEAFSGTEVLVTVGPPDVETRDPNPHGPACLVTERMATIVIRDPAYFDAQGIAHELLHIERFWNEGIPQILPKQSDNERMKITSAIENTLEHLIIVPREALYGFEPFSHWNRTTTSNWASYPWPDIPDPWARRKNCLLGWLTVSNLVSDESVREYVEDCLRSEGLLNAAVDLQRKVGLSLKNKARTVAHVVKAIDIPASDVELVQFDIRRRKRHSMSIPR
jgi:hypothetical protein